MNNKVLESRMIVCFQGVFYTPDRHCLETFKLIDIACGIK
jgi:hypothetical protein